MLNARLVVALLCLMLVTGLAWAGPKVFKDGQMPDDVRLGPLKTLNDYFPFEPSASPDAWQQRAQQVRRRVLVAEGMWPTPTRTPLKAVVHGKRDMGDYTIEKVYFQSIPGHFVTGSLYRPDNEHGLINGKRPGILCPHGHWSNGRFYDRGEANAKKQIESGGAAFISAGRSPLQARMVHLARLGCVVFHYDMEGYADSVHLAHRPGVRPHMFRGASKDAPDDSWGFFSPQAELRLQGMMGLQTWNSTRALDFLLSLPDVDGDRIGVTGGSGGGTQSMILAAIDDRVDVSVPAVMVSTAMQGGCTGENANYLRVGTGNVEFAALFAPKPQALIAADDWTKELMTKGYPQLQQHYRLVGAPDHITAAAYLQYKHNYNYPNRQVAYKWFNKHFQLGHDKPEVERDFAFQSAEQLTVWTDGHEKPTNTGDSHERRIVAHITADSEKLIDALRPKDAKSLAEFRHVVGGALQTMIDRDLPRAESVTWSLVHKVQRGDIIDMSGTLYHDGHKEHVPAAFFWPRQWNKQVVIWLDERGKSAMYQDDGSPIPPVQRLLDAGYSVASLDMFGTGEFTPDGQPLKKQKMGQYSDGKAPWQKFAGYTFGYNHSLFARRVHDILTMISFVKSYKPHPTQKAHLFAVNGTGKWGAVAAALGGEQLASVVVDTGGYRFDSITTLDDADMQPGIVKYGDVPSLLALCAPVKMWVSGEDEAGVAWAADAYRAAGKADGLVRHEGLNTAHVDAAVDWLLRE